MSARRYSSEYKAIQPYVIEEIRKITRTGEVARGGAAALAAHTLADTSVHIGPLAQTQAPWASTKAELATHAADPNAHHARQHSIIGSADHTVTGNQWQVVGLTAANTLGLLTPLSDVTGATKQALLKSDAQGGIKLNQLAVGAAMTLYSDGNVANGPDIAFSGAGLLSADDSIYFVADDTNTGVGAFVFLKGAPNSSGAELMRLTNSGRLGIGNNNPTYALDVTGEARATTALRTATAYATTKVQTPLIDTAAGDLQISPFSGITNLSDLRASTRLRTPLLDTASGDLTINPASRTLFADDKQIRSQTHTAGFLGTGFSISWPLSGKAHLDIRSAYMEELEVTAFQADVMRLRVAEDFLGQSMGQTSRAFTTPAAIGSTVRVYFENNPAFAGQIFLDNEWVMFQVIQRGAGLLNVQVWGKVDSYLNEGNGEQSWRFRLQSGPTGLTVNKSSIALSFGLSGSGYIHSNVLRNQNGPWTRYATWSGADPFTPANRRVHAQSGNLNGLVDITTNRYGTAAGNNLALTPTTGFSGFTADDTGGLRLFNTAIDLYRAGVQTVDWQPDGSLWIGTSADKKFEFDAASGQVRIANSLLIGSGLGFATDALLYVGFDAGDPRYGASGDATGHLGQPATLIGSPTFRPGKFGSALEVSAGTTNLIANSSFEADTVGALPSGWANYSYAGSGGTVLGSRLVSNLQSFDGRQSVRIARDDGTDQTPPTLPLGRLGIRYTVACTPGQLYSISARVWLGALTNPVAGQNNAVLWVQEVGGSAAYSTAGTASQVGWQELRTTLTPTTTSFYVYVWLANCDVGEMYVDAVQATAGPQCPYWPGENGVRPASAVQYGPLVGFDWQKFTISTWVRSADIRNAVSGHQRLFAVGSGNNVVELHWYPDGSLYGYYYAQTAGGSGSVFTRVDRITSPITDAGWHHVALVVDYPSISLYVDGAIPFPAQGIKTLTRAGVGTPASVTLGRGWSGSAPFDGWLDDFAIIPRALTATEIAQIAQGNAPIRALAAPSSLLLTNVSAADGAINNVTAHGGGIFGSRGASASFALLNDIRAAWGGFSNLDAGDIVLGHNKAGGTAIFYDQSSGTFGFYGGGVGTPQVTINATGEMRAGGGVTAIAADGFSMARYITTAGTPIAGTESKAALAWWDDINDRTGAAMTRIYAGRSAAGAGGTPFLSLEVDPANSDANKRPAVWLIGGNIPQMWFTDIYQFVGLPGILPTRDFTTFAETVQLTGRTILKATLERDASVATVDLGTSGSPFRTLYVGSIVADTITGGTSIGGAIWQNDAGDMYIKSSTGTDTGTRTLYIANPGNGVMNLDVEGSILVGGNVDGVKISTFKGLYDAHVLNANAHHAQSHSYDSTDHTGLLSWSKLNKAGSSLADLETRSHASLTEIGANDHHNQQHTLDGSDHIGSLSWSKVNKTGASLADLPTRNYSDLAARGHVLATTTGLGTDHTVSGLTAGQVLRASSATGAAFAQLQHGDLGGVGANDHHNQQHTLDGTDHTGTLSWSKVNKTGSNLSHLETRAHSSLTGIGANDHHNQQHGLVSTDHVASGLLVGQTIRATGTTTFAWSRLGVGDLTPGTVQYQIPVTGADPFALSYVALSSFAGDGLDFISGKFVVGVVGLGLSTTTTQVSLTSSNNPGTTAAILATNSSGLLTLADLAVTATATVGTKVRTPLIDTASGVDLSLLPATGTVKVGGSLKLHTTNNIETGPDISFANAGLITALNGLYLVVDSNNSGVGALTFAKGANTSAATVLMTLTNGGNLGIGMSPTYRLDVSGDIRASTAVRTVTVYASADVVTPDVSTSSGNLTLSPASGITTLSALQASTYLQAPTLQSAASTHLTIAPGADLVLAPVNSIVRLAAGDLIKSNSFATGFAGNGWQIDDGVLVTGKSSAEFDNLTIRGLLRVYELIVSKIRTGNGSYLFSDGGRVASVTGTGPYTLSFDEDHGFAANDLIRAQKFLGGAYTSSCTVTSTPTTKQAVVTLNSGSAPQAGYEYTRIGSTSNTDRRGSVYITSNDSGAPYLDVIDGIAAHTDWGQAGKIKVRLGKLTGVGGVASEYGLYAGTGTAATDRWIRLSGDANGNAINNLPFRLRNNGQDSIVFNAWNDVWWGKDAANKVVEFNGSELTLRSALHIGSGTGFATDAILYCAFDGPMDGSAAGNATGHLGQPETLSGNPQFRPGRFGKAIETTEALTTATINKCINPSFEGDTVGAAPASWSNYGSGNATGTRLATDKLAYDGSKSLEIIRTAGDATAEFGSRYTFPVVAGQTYSIQARVRVTSATGRTGDVLQMRAAGGTLTSASVTAASDTTTGWQVVKLKATATGNGSAALDFYTTNCTTCTAYIDAVQITQTAYHLPFWNPQGATSRPLTYAKHRDLAINPQAFTVSLWFRLEDLASAVAGRYLYLFELVRQNGAGVDNTNRIVTQITPTNRLFMYTNGDGQSVFAQSPVDVTAGADVWHHVAMTIDGSLATLYFNGVSVATMTVPVSPMGIFEMRHGISNGNTWPLNGWLDDVALIGRALSAAEIGQIYASGTPLRVLSSPFELQLTRAAGSSIYTVAGHAGGLFGSILDTTNGAVSTSFALLNDTRTAWGGFNNLAPGDLVLGHNKAGSAAIRYDRVNGVFGFYGDNNATPKVTINNDGTITAVQATLSGDVTATSGAIGGWTLGTTALSSTNILLQSGTNAYISVGSSSAMAGMTGSGSTLLWAGSSFAGRATAPFTVSSDGVLHAEGAEIDGDIRAETGWLGGLTNGWKIESLKITSTNITLQSGAANAAYILAGTGATAGGINAAGVGTDIVFWAGSTHGNRAAAATAFKVTAAGVLTATSADITGSIKATSGYIGGTTDGWAIASKTLSSTNIKLQSGTTDARLEVGSAGAYIGGVAAGSAAADVVFWAGSTYDNRALAATPFRVTLGGKLYAMDSILAGGVVKADDNGLAVYGQSANTRSDKNAYLFRTNDAEEGPLGGTYNYYDTSKTYTELLSTGSATRTAYLNVIGLNTSGTLGAEADIKAVSTAFNARLWLQAPVSGGSYAQLSATTIKIGAPHDTLASYLLLNGAAGTLSIVAPNGFTYGGNAIWHAGNLNISLYAPKASPTFTGTATAAALSVTGATSLAALTVTGTTSLAALTVTGTTSLATLTVTGTTSLATLTTSGHINTDGALYLKSNALASVPAQSGYAALFYDGTGVNLRTPSASYGIWHAGNFDPANYVQLTSNSNITTTGDIAARHLSASGNAYIYGGLVYSNAAIGFVNTSAVAQAIRAGSALYSSDFNGHIGRVPTNGIYSLGGVAIGTPNVITTGYMLDVNGAALVRGALRVSSSILIDNSGSSDPSGSMADGETRAFIIQVTGAQRRYVIIHRISSSDIRFFWFDLDASVDSTQAALPWYKSNNWANVTS